MAQAVLERKAVTLPDFDREERTIRFLLDKEAREALGATVLTPEEQAFSLHLALADLGIEPYTPESVAAYQKEKEAEMNREAKEGSAQSRRRCWRAALALWGIAVLWFATSIFLFPAKTWSEENPNFLLVFAPTLVLASFGLMAAISATDEPRRWHWESVPTHNHGEPIPAFAAQSALAIRERAPSAEFAIEELSLGSRTNDPFLVVYAGDEKHYIEVWEEPTFPGRAS